jgi:hypothetical protein
MSDTLKARLADLANAVDKDRGFETMLTDTLREALARIEELERLTWLDFSPGDVVHWYADGTIVLDDGVTTYNPLRALAACQRELDRARGLLEVVGYDAGKASRDPR